MPKKVKLELTDLKVKSFSTSNDELKGGTIRMTRMNCSILASVMNPPCAYKRA